MVFETQRYGCSKYILLGREVRVTIHLLQNFNTGIRNKLFLIFYPSMRTNLYSNLQLFTAPWSGRIMSALLSFCAQNFENRMAHKAIWPSDIRPFSTMTFYDSVRAAASHLFSATARYGLVSIAWALLYTLYLRRNYIIRC